MVFDFFRVDIEATGNDQVLRPAGQPDISIARYAGYDLSDVALSHARQNLGGLGCTISLRHGDFLEGLRANTERFDLIFCSFALHHLSSIDKAVFFQLVYQRLAENGILLLIDTMREENQDLQSYLDRYCEWLERDWTALPPVAVDAICNHVRSRDFPETTLVLCTMAANAGFNSHTEINRFRWHRTWRFDKA